MSFGPSAQTRQAESNLGNIATTATGTELPMINAAGQNLFGMGLPLTTTGANFFNTILGGNRANTAALLQPDINAINQSQANTLRAINTLMPRSGGRFGTLFGQSFAPQAQIQNLFAPMRAQAASALPQIGGQLTGQGINLFGMGPSILNAATGASSNLGNIAQRQQEISNQLWSNLGAGIFGLATLPLGGAGGLLGTALGRIPGLGGGGVGGASFPIPGYGPGSWTGVPVPGV